MYILLIHGNKLKINPPHNTSTRRTLTSQTHDPGQLLELRRRRRRRRRRPKNETLQRQHANHTAGSMYTSSHLYLATYIWQGKSAEGGRRVGDQALQVG